MRLNDLYILRFRLLLLDGMHEPARAPFLDVRQEQAVDASPVCPTTQVAAQSAMRL
jgi:hypothetical protein